MKPPLHLIPPSANILESMVYKLGEGKYGTYNWRSTNPKVSQYVAAAYRHLGAWYDGQNMDPESGCSHLAHVRACMGILIDALELGRAIDDRPTRGSAARLIQVLTETAIVQEQANGETKS